jgi:hypothetical protein
LYTNNNELMANYLSREDRFNRVQDPVNINLINSVLSAKQGKYDQGVAQIDQTLAEFKAIEGRLARDSDKEYLANNIQGLLDQVNNSGKLDLSNSGITRNIKSQINSALDSKVINAVAQSSKITSFQAEMAEKRKSGKGDFDEGNYQDALERAGVQDYMKGTNSKGEAVDVVGNLSYTDYIDVAAEQNKLAMEFAKNVGTEQYLRSANTQYQTVDLYGKRVSKTDLENYITSNLGNKSIAQLQINARQSFGKMLEGDFNKMMTAHTQSENDEMKLGIARGEAELKGMTGEQAEQQVKDIADYKQALKEGTDKADKGVFDRSEMYGYYTKNFVKKIADNYDIDVVTKADKNNLPWDIYKSDRDYNLEVEKLSIAKLKADKDAKLLGGGGGTETTRMLLPEEQTMTDLDKMGKKTYHTSKALDAYLRQNDEGYSNKSPQEQWAYMLALKANPRAKDQGAEYKNLVDEFKDAQGSYSSTLLEGETKLKEHIGTEYNKMIGGSINLKNLGREMPLTARLIGSGRKYESLNNSEKAALTAETASNYIKNGVAESDEVNKLYEKVIVKNKGYVAKNSKELSKEISQVSPERDKGFFGNLMEGMQAAPKLIKNLADELIHVPVKMYNYAVQGEYYGAEQEAKFNKEQKEDWNGIMDKVSSGLKAGRSTFTPYVIGNTLSAPFRQDSNITEIQSGDLRQDGKSAPGDVGDSFHALNQQLTTLIQKKSASYLPNLDRNKAFSFSTDDKTQAGVADKLKAAILNVRDDDGNSPAIPSSKNIITISREGSQYRVDYLTGSGEKQVQTSTLVPELPPDIRGGFEDRQQEWRNDPKNTNIRLEPVTMSMYSDLGKRNGELRNYTQNLRDKLPREVISKLNLDPSDTSYATRAEKIASIKKGYSKDFYDKNKSAIDGILSTAYTSTPVVDYGEFFFKIAFKNEDGDMEERLMPNSLGQEKDDYLFDFYYREGMGQLIDSRIAQLQD